MENILFLLFALSFLFLMAVHLYQTNRFFGQLKEKHLALWQELGQPRWQIHFGDDSFKNAMKYIRQKKFEHLNDDVLKSCYTVIKRVEWTAVVIALVIIVMTIIDILGEM